MAVTALRVGLVGCGGMGNEHLNIIDNIPDVTLVGVCDHRPERARRMGAAHGVAFWLDYIRFLEEARPDVVHICSPSGLHGSQGIEAAQRGIHVLSEKPLDINLDKVDQLIAACDRNDVRWAAFFSGA